MSDTNLDKVYDRFELTAPCETLYLQNPSRMPQQVQALLLPDYLAIHGDPGGQKQSE
jgi:hypothetical protein